LAAVVGPHSLKSQPTTQAAHYLAGDPHDPTSEVIVRHLPVLTRSSTGPQVEISLDLGRGVTRSAGSDAERDAEIKLLPQGYRRW
jgi:hypothetical protein